MINPAFMRYVHDIWLEKKGRYPSTGFMALVLSLHICDEVIIKHLSIGVFLVNVTMLL